MIEYTYKVYTTEDDADYLRVSDLSLEDAMIFVQALCAKFYAEDKISYKIELIKMVEYEMGDDM